MGYDERKTVNLVLDHKDKPTLKLELRYSYFGITVVGTCQRGWTHDIVTITNQGELIRHELFEDIGMALDGRKIKERPYGPPKTGCFITDCVFHGNTTDETEDICTDCIYSTSNKENKVDHAEYDMPDED